MITKLTPQQESMMPVYVDKWLKIGLSTERIDKKKAIEKWHKFDREILDSKKERLVLIMDSPLQTWFAVCMLYNNYKELYSQVWNQVRRQVMSQVVSQVENQVRNQVENQVWNQVRNQVRSQVVSQVVNQVRNQIESQVRSQVWRQIEEQIPNFVYPYLNNSNWAGYYAYYEFMNKELEIKFKKQKEWDLLLSLYDLSWIYPLNGVCIMSEKPVEIHMKDGRLHNEKGMSIRYADGFGTYSLNGVRVTKDIVMTPAEQLDPKMLISEKNVEVRREIMRKIGVSRILQKLSAQLLNTWREYELYNIDNIDIEPVHILKMRCPSTGVYYALRTPPDIHTAREAIVWCNHGNFPENIKVEW